MTFWKDHFDHVLLFLLIVLGAVGGICCAIYKIDKPSDWCFVTAAAALSALLMRMTGPRPSPAAQESPKV